MKPKRIGRWIAGRAKSLALAKEWQGNPASDGMIPSARRSPGRAHAGLSTEARATRSIMIPKVELSESPWLHRIQFAKKQEPRAAGRL